MNTLSGILSPRISSRISSLTFPAVQTVFRIGVGLLFMQHGAQKLFGWLGGIDGQGGTASLFSLMGTAGILEFFGGLLITVGLLTRPVAFLLAGQMVVAYFMAHAPQGGFPIQNGGELALFYALSFALLVTTGGGAWSLDGLLCHDEAGKTDDHRRRASLEEHPKAVADREPERTTVYPPIHKKRGVSSK